ncbi:ATP-binding cassette domain-containing protein [Streptomyces sp. NPDC059708]|uniref:ABC transporter ATP-binding protein n=1 Tax=Streptomyces sp. NPDC059708 TaxID=3346916 RepID=UPI0036CDD36C
MRLAAVGRRYGRRRPWVLRGVEAELAPGTLVRIEGGNGCGKSTLLRLLAGIDTPTEGRITGRPRRTAYVPERFPAALPLTAGAYLAHLGRVQGLNGAEAARRAVDRLERFGAGACARTPLSELSKGTSQKVAVAQALLADPGLLVLDEAWTGLDASARAELDRAVAERTAAGGTVVFVDHDPARLTDRPDARYRLRGGTLEPVAAGPSVPDAGPGVPAAGLGLSSVPDVVPGVPTAVPSVPTAVPSVPAAGLTVPAAGPGVPAGPVRGAVVRIHASGPPGSVPPEGAVPAPGGGFLLTVGAGRSDAVLRELLTARPPWHIRAVEELP